MVSVPALNTPPPSPPLPGQWLPQPPLPVVFPLKLLLITVALPALYKPPPGPPLLPYMIPAPDPVLLSATWVSIIPSLPAL